MAALKLFGIAAVLAAATPGTAADPLDRWRPAIAEAARRFAIPPDWIERVMRAESGGRTMLGGRPITSPAGAMGLMQLMPGTWTALREALDLGRDPYDPHDNIIAGAAYLAGLYRRFGYPGLFAAYNAGPARYAAWRAGSAALPAETSAYLAAVGGDDIIAAPDARRAPGRDPLFAVRASGKPAGMAAGAGARHAADRGPGAQAPGASPIGDGVSDSRHADGQGAPSTAGTLFAIRTTR